MGNDKTEKYSPKINKWSFSHCKCSSLRKQLHQRTCDVLVIVSPQYGQPENKPFPFFLLRQTQIQILRPWGWTAKENRERQFLKKKNFWKSKISDTALACIQFPLLLHLAMVIRIVEAYRALMASICMSLRHLLSHQNGNVIGPFHFQILLSGPPYIKPNSIVSNSRLYQASLKLRDCSIHWSHGKKKMK